MAFHLRSIAPVIGCTDVASTSAWYADKLGFAVQLHGDGPRHAFAILCRDGVELMLRCVETFSPTGDWDAYVRVDDVDDLHEHARAHGVTVVEPLRSKDYGQREFAIEDPSGLRIVFGSDILTGRA